MDLGNENIMIHKNGVYRLTTMRNYEKKFKRLGYEIESDLIQDIGGVEVAKGEGLQGQQGDQEQQEGKEKGKKKKEKN